MKEQVYRILQCIPTGQVATYGQIAKMLGNNHYARMVGNILHENPDGEKFPCYKVVNSKRQLAHKYAFGGIERQKEKLEADGIEVTDYKVDLKKYQWKDNEG